MKLKMMKSKTFSGANVFMSRNLVPPEIFDALHDALKQNGAEVFLCCDPSRNSPNDYHIISSPDHEKFEDLRAKGCNLLGPQCVLSCAKEHRPLPKQGFSCCLAMDGVKVLASGFEMDERIKIAKMVEAMSGVLSTKATLDVSFVIVKNVLAAKYKWALNTLKKPIVTTDWLHQCWNEHRVVPQESYRVLPFSGLIICVSRIPADERKEMEKIIVQNGGRYSAELTKKCTHLICDQAPEGDKYKVARRWGHIHIVNKKWFDQSIARRACLSEESYPVQTGSVASTRTMSDCSMPQQNWDKKTGNSQYIPSSLAGDSKLPDVSWAGPSDPDMETTLSQDRFSTFSDAPVCSKDADGEASVMQIHNETKLDSSVANDSQSEENDLYLSECRILIVGFEASEMRKLIHMVRRGGGSRYMSFNDKLTHIVVGNPSEIEKKEVRGLAALGVIRVVRTTWLEDCDREKKELPILQRHIASDILFSKESVCSTKAAIGMTGIMHDKISTMPSDLILGTLNSGARLPSEKLKEENHKLNQNGECFLDVARKSPENSQFPAHSKTDSSVNKLQPGASAQMGKSSSVFRGRKFCFSSSFPEDRRSEIIQWINQGGGVVVDDHIRHDVNFIIECHGVIPSSSSCSQIIPISSHWIRSCLEDGCLLDISSHILYSPLPCQIPLPGFKSFRFCVSQYEDKDRILLRNLCFVLGAKFMERLTKKVTHLLCKFKNGPKYEAACKWGIHSVTSDWIYECVRKNKVVALDSFCPKEVTSQDQEARTWTMSQFPVTSRDFVSQYPSQSQETQIAAQAVGSRKNSTEENVEGSHILGKRSRLLEDNSKNGFSSIGVYSTDPICKIKSAGPKMSEDAGELPRAVPDVAAVIEDLLEQTSKIHDVNSPEQKDCDESIFSSDSSIMRQDHSSSLSVTGLSNNWLKRTAKKGDTGNPSRDAGGVSGYDGFSETQTDSQVVGYEEDLSGRQMLIDRVRTRSSLT